MKCILSHDLAVFEINIFTALQKEKNVTKIHSFCESKPPHRLQKRGVRHVMNLRSVNRLQGFTVYQIRANKTSVSFEHHCMTDSSRDLRGKIKQLQEQEDLKRGGTQLQTKLSLKAREPR